MEVSLIFAISAFAAGVLTFLAPCTLPLVPAYLGFISGVPTNSDQQITTRQHQRIIINAAAFVIGFSIIFVLFGVLAGLFGQAVSAWRNILTRISGVLIIGFGLVMLFDRSLPIFTGTNLTLPNWARGGNPASSLAIGAGFAFGWTPCVGPILGSILLLASQQATAVTGGLLLLIFSAGLAVPFLLLAVLYTRFSRWIKNANRVISWMNRIGGLFLIALGALLISNNFSILIQYGYQLFDFVNYQSLEQFL